MDGLSILIILLVILALAGVVFYFVYDYLDYKNKTTSDINTANSAITAEGKERLGNLAYVVNQVNTVNDDIYGTLTSNIVFTNSNVDIQTKKTDNLVNSFSKVMTFNTIGSTPSISLFDLPGTPGNINMNLLKHVTATMGLTASNLTPGAPAEFCSATGCVKFPDSSGNTFLGPLTTGGQVVLDGAVRVNNGVTFGGTGAPALTTANQNSFTLNSKYVGIGNTNPAYTLDVLGKSGDNLLKATSTDTPAGTSPALLVNANGDLIVSQSIQIKPTTAGATAISIYGSADKVPPNITDRMNTVVIAPDALTGSLNISVPGGLNIYSNRSKFYGNVDVEGSLSVRDDARIRGNLDNGEFLYTPSTTPIATTPTLASAPPPPPLTLASAPPPPPLTLASAPPPTVV